MKEMFYNCFSLTTLSLTEIETISKIDASYMFYNCSKLEHFTNSFYYSDIRVNDMKYMFYNCISLNDAVLSIFNSYRDDPYISLSNAFYNCYSLNSIKGFSNIIISNISNMLYNCTSLLSINFNPKDVVIKINMENMFYNCIQLF